ncbi:sugar ABC transporter ATP-binding protein [Brachyspira aalborgi]|uniref:sugar ABC transporter ATP-binding protein n=1 Tax=Brachyspira aalborgi TaxID=29522 RepID=UPI00266D65F1|nr:sugar ABC transporter ATP-binding protein [Brachyspira aalborgi]
MENLLELNNIWKVFDGVPVLKGLDISLAKGEVHAILGGNGSGKSTLMKIISGTYQSSNGTIKYLGKEVNFTRPYQAHREGIYLVPQEPKIFPYLSILENITIGLSKVNGETIEKVKSIAEIIDFKVSLRDDAGKLTIANQQLVEIIRGLIRNAKVLILDEPTSTLTVKEVKSLFDIVRPLLKNDIGVFFISHRINEIFDFSDRISVLRDGNIVLSGNTSDFKPIDLIKAMIGNSDYNVSQNCNTKYDIGKVILSVHNLSSEVFKDISFDVRESETLGIAGIVGAGRTELASAIVGLEPYHSGEVIMDGKKLIPFDAKSAREAKISYIPEDRHKYGIFLDIPFYETISSEILKKISKVFLNKKQEKEISKKYVDELKIKVLNDEQYSRMLSGGNQQKVVISKILTTEPKVVILDEPTRGVDAKAREDVFQIVRNLKKKGVAVILISSDLEEVINNSDRIIVIHSGEINLELDKKDFSMEIITQASFGVI